VVWLTKIRAPISAFDRPSRASRAICASWGVRSSPVSTVRLRACSPVAISSRSVRPANPSVPMLVNISSAVVTTRVATGRVSAKVLSRHEARPSREARGDQLAAGDA
jgi:hypothetical protein